MLPRYRTDGVVLMEFIRQVSTIVAAYKEQKKIPSVLFPVSMDWYMSSDLESIKHVVGGLKLMYL